MSQSTEPSVCAVMLTANRPEMARQAVECFRRQTYQNRRLLILNSGSTHVGYQDWVTHEDGSIMELWRQSLSGSPVGVLRNVASEASETTEAEILIHWDDDDYSHPNRISEQVALLESSGADVVGYNEMLFWREPDIDTNGMPEVILSHHPDRGFRERANGAAWLYTNRDRAGYALGTSLCYWRKTWERKPFEATSRGEDNKFLAGLKLARVSSIESFHAAASKAGEPRMVARIHSGNTSENYAPSILEQSTNWKRVPEWDTYCKGVFSAA